MLDRKRMFVLITSLILFCLIIGIVAVWIIDYRILGLVVYALTTSSCIYLGIMFMWWMKKADAISTIWYYQTALFWSIGISKGFAGVAKAIKLFGSIDAYNSFLKTFWWNIKDIPVACTVLVFVIVVSWRTLVVRKTEVMFPTKNEAGE